MENENIYSTRDLVLAVTLITLKFELIKIDYQIEGENQRPVGYFNFENTNALKETIRKHMNGDLSVEPKQFMSNVRELKAQINNFYKNPNNKF